MCFLRQYQKKAYDRRYKKESNNNEQNNGEGQHLKIAKHMYGKA